MQPRTLDQIISELQPSYQPSIEFLRQRQAEIPKTVESDIQAAQAAQTQAYEDILTGARRRGLGFAGIPLGEQAKYASQVFAPAVLQARTRGTEAARDLEGTILGLQAEMRNAAIARRQREQDIATELANASRGGGAAASDTSSVLSNLLAYLSGGTGTATQRPSLSSIFGTPPPQATQPQIRVTAPTPQNIVQPSAGVRLQPTGPALQPAGRTSLQATTTRLQGGIPMSSGTLRVR
jgi:hypothetical protein